MIESALNEIRVNLKDIIGKLGLPPVDFIVEPSEPGFGDLTSNIAFLLAKHLKTKPAEIAQDIAKQYTSLNNTLIDGVTAMPSGHLNFALEWSRFARLVLAESQSEININLGKREPIIVEHTSVNPNKALHIGHLRNMIIGDVISKILSKVNYDIRVLNYIDDLGLQIADIVVGFRHLGFAAESPDKRFDHYCGDDVYVQTHKIYDSDPTLKKVRADTLVQLEDTSSDVGRFAQDITRRVLACQLETCWKIGVFYDCLNFESHIIRSGLWSKLFDKLRSMNLIELETEGDNAGCWVFRIKDEKDKVLVRSSGTATYIAKDISYAAWKLGLIDDPFLYTQYDVVQPNTKTLYKSVLKDGKKIDFSCNKVLTVIDSRQARLQNIISNILTNFVPDTTYVHLSYGAVTLSADTAKSIGIDAKGNQTQMSGRSGLYVSIDAVYDMLRERARVETRTRNPDMSHDKIDGISHDIAVGTLRYEMIKQDLERNIIFDLTKSLSLTGDTATYLMYTLARASRILERAYHKVSEFDHSAIDCSVFSTSTELALIRDISMYSVHVRDSANNLSPKIIARYCHELAVSFNSFYEGARVLGIEPSIETARLWLVHSFCNVIKDALDILGIPVPDKM